MDSRRQRPRGTSRTCAFSGSTPALPAQSEGHRARPPVRFNKPCRKFSRTMCSKTSRPSHAQRMNFLGLEAAFPPCPRGTLRVSPAALCSEVLASGPGPQEPCRRPSRGENVPAWKYTGYLSFLCRPGRWPRCQVRKYFNKSPRFFCSCSLLHVNQFLKKSSFSCIISSNIAKSQTLFVTSAF